MKKKQRSYLVTLVLACATFYFALHLSAGDRGPVDYVVLLLIAGAIVYNVVQLRRRLFAAGGARSVWHLIRTILFWTIGLMNTALARSTDIGTWKYWLGWGILGLAVMDTFLIYRLERELIARPAGATDADNAAASSDGQSMAQSSQESSVEEDTASAPAAS